MPIQIRLRSYVFTLNNYTQEQFTMIKGFIPDIAKYAIIGEEIAPETKTPHLQGYVQLLKQTAFSTIKKWWKDNFDALPHIERAKGDPEQNYKYCSKEKKFWEHGNKPEQGKRTDLHEFFTSVKNGLDDEELSDNHPVEFAKYHKAANLVRDCVSNKKTLQQLKDQFKDATPKKWQAEALTKLEQQDDRKVLWIVDEKGGMGKSWLADYLDSKGNCFLIEGGKRQDIAYAYNKQPIVVFDFTRQQEEQVNYSTIESFKNGRIFSNKYTSSLKRFPKAKVLCLSNFSPDTSKLSNDRWDIMTLPKKNNKVTLKMCNCNNCNEYNCFCTCHMN